MFNSYGPFGSMTYLRLSSSSEAHQTKPPVMSSDDLFEGLPPPAVVANDLFTDDSFVVSIFLNTHVAYLVNLSTIVICG